MRVKKLIKGKAQKMYLKTKTLRKRKDYKSCLEKNQLENKVNYQKKKKKIDVDSHSNLDNLSCDLNIKITGKIYNQKKQCIH